MLQKFMYKMIRRGNAKTKEETDEKEVKKRKRYYSCSIGSNHRGIINFSRNYNHVHNGRE